MNRFIEESYSLYKDSVGMLNTRKRFSFYLLLSHENCTTLIIYRILTYGEKKGS